MLDVSLDRYHWTRDFRSKSGLGIFRKILKHCKMWYFSPTIWLISLEKLVRSSRIFFVREVPLDKEISEVIRIYLAELYL